MSLIKLSFYTTVVFFLIADVVGGRSVSGYAAVITAVVSIFKSPRPEACHSIQRIHLQSSVRVEETQMPVIWIRGEGLGI